MPTHPDSVDMHEWKFLSQLHPGNNLEVDDLDMLGHRDFDSNHNWNHTTIPSTLHETAENFIEFNRSFTQI